MNANVLNENPLVSIVMPAYNASRFIEEAIRSVVDQTEKDWELFVIDDCSTDDSFAIAQKQADKDPRIRVLRNDTNLGVAHTRNKGLSLCRGQYVALLDSDDYWKSNWLEKMIARAKETNADIIYCSYELVDERGVKVCNDFIVPPTTTFEQSIIRSVITCTTVMVTSDFAEKHSFSTNIYHEDIALWFDALRAGAVAVGVPDVLAAYRQRENSRSANKLTSAARRWIIYRKYLKLSFFKSCRVMMQYGYYGLVKFKRI